MNLNRIREFAKTNFKMEPSDPRCVSVYAADQCVSVTNPWVGQANVGGAMGDLTDEQTVGYWGLAVVLEFCRQAEAVLENRDYEAADDVLQDADGVETHNRLAKAKKTVNTSMSARENPWLDENGNILSDEEAVATYGLQAVLTACKI